MIGNFYLLHIKSLHLHQMTSIFLHFNTDIDPYFRNRVGTSIHVRQFYNLSAPHSGGEQACP